MFWSRISLPVVYLLLSACGGGTKDNATPAPAAAATVTVFPVAAANWPETVEAPGTVRARTIAALSSRSVGYIRQVNAREGDRVEAGQVLVTLEAGELKSARQQAKATLEEARAEIDEADNAVQSAQIQVDLNQTTLRRMRELLGKRSVSQHEFDEASAQARMAEAARSMAQARRRQLDHRIRQSKEGLESADTQLGYLEVHAPFSGRVVARNAEPGILAMPGVPLFEIESEDGYRLEAAVPEAHLGSIHVGRTTQVRLDALPTLSVGRVEEIVPQIHSGSRSFLVKIALPTHSRLRSGLFGRALFQTGERSVVSVPRAAIAGHGQLRNVLVVADGVVRSRMVRTGGEREGQIEILSGLSAGERVVFPRPAGIHDGQPVEVKP